MEPIKVSIVCVTYNHEKYIQTAIESFLMQKTNFRYEIIIHDDASSDNTPFIIREYQKKYPNIIRPIFQKENQFSHHISVHKNFIIPVIKGEYVALCDGDDYWTDPLKIQMQANILDQFSNIDICTHATEIVYSDSKKKKKLISPSKKNRIFSVEDVICGGGGFVATNSIMYRASLDKNIPFFRKKTGDDYAIQIHGSLNGGMFFVSKVMSAYRYHAEGSWTTSMNNNISKRLKYFDDIKLFLHEVDEFTNHNYAHSIEKRILEEEFIVIELQNKCKMLLNKKFKSVWKKLDFIHKMKIIIKAIFPFIYNMKRKI